MAHICLNSTRKCVVMEHNMEHKNRNIRVVREADFGTTQELQRLKIDGKGNIKAIGWNRAEKREKAARFSIRKNVGRPYVSDGERRK